MHDPNSYDAYSELQRRDAKELIPYLVNEMVWNKSNYMILEVGCGSGFNSRIVLIPSLKNASAASSFTYAVDVSKKMIDFASAKYSHADVTYVIADITKEDYKYPCQFDKIFSFHVLHWIHDQEKVLGQLFRLLNKNGEVGMFYVAKTAMFTAYELMSKNTVWAPYLTDANIIPKSHFSKDLAKNLHQIMSSIGYHVQESRTCTRSFQFTSLEALMESKSIRAAPTNTTPNAIQINYDLMIIRALKL